MALGTFEALPILRQSDRRFADWAGQDVEQVFGDHGFTVL